MFEAEAIGVDLCVCVSALLPELCLSMACLSGWQYVVTPSLHWACVNTEAERTAGKTPQLILN